MLLTYSILSNQANQWVIAFYGFGQEASFFAPFTALTKSNYNVLVIDLPYAFHPNKISIADFQHFLEELFLKHQIEKVIGISYSMGSRLNVCMATIFPQKISQLFLIAPDGIRMRWWTTIATKTNLGHLVFRFFTNHPTAYIRGIHLLFQMGLMPKSLYTFSKWHMRDATTRMKVYHSWMNLRSLIPNLNIFERMIQKHAFPVVAYFGLQDKIINHACRKQLARKVPSANIILLNKGHMLADAELFADIARRIV